eukprot:UC1_evm3s1935
MASADQASVSSVPVHVFVGQGNGNVALLELDAVAGTLSEAASSPVHIGEGNAMFLAHSRKHNTIYTVRASMHYEEAAEGKILAFGITEEGGRLNPLGPPVSSCGRGPCHLSLDATESFLLVANYESGHVAALPLDPDTGSVGAPLVPAALARHGDGVYAKDGGRQDGAHPHQILVGPQNRFVYVCDLGLDIVRVYAFAARDGTGSLTPKPELDARLPAGSGPRHLAFHPQLPSVAYCVNELNNTVAVFSVDPVNGSLKPHARQQELTGDGSGNLAVLSTLPADYNAPPPFDFYTAPSHAAEVAVTPCGKWVLCTNRGHDSVTRFPVEADTGALTLTTTPPTYFTEHQGGLPWHCETDLPFYLSKHGTAGVEKEGGEEECIEGGGKRETKGEKGSSSSAHHTSVSPSSLFLVSFQYDKERPPTGPGSVLLCEHGKDGRTVVRARVDLKLPMCTLCVATKK